MSSGRPSKSTASVFLPSSVPKRYSFSTGTHGSSRRRRASSSLRRVSSFSSSRRQPLLAFPTRCALISGTPARAGARVAELEGERGAAARDLPPADRGVGYPLADDALQPFENRTAAG